MPEMQEVFRMATQKVRPDPGFVDRQYENQRRQARRRKVGALALAAVLVIAGVVIGISTLRNDELRQTPAEPSPPEATQKPIPGCVPACASGFADPGPLPKGRYRTVEFFGGWMHVTLKSGWTSREDSSGAFVLSRGPSLKNEIFFWEDVYPVDRGTPVDGVPMTVDGLLNWIDKDPRLQATAPQPGRIGDLPATIVDVTISKGAKNQDPGYCPSDTCVLWLGFPQWNDTWGIAEPQVQRFYLSDVTYGGKAHLFVAVVYPDDPKDMETFASQAEPVINSVQVPATPA